VTSRLVFGRTGALGTTAGSTIEMFETRSSDVMPVCLDRETTSFKTRWAASRSRFFWSCSVPRRDSSVISALAASSAPATLDSWAAAAR
jgi:hypothetical protein